MEPDFLRGATLCSQGRYAEALEIFDQVVALYPDSAPFRLKRGHALLGLGRHEQALSEFEAAARIQPDFADAYLNIGVVLQRQGKLLEALTLFDKAIEINGSLAAAYAYRGIARLGLNGQEEKSGADADLKRAVALDPDLKPWIAKRRR